MDELFSQENITADEIVLLSSPFVRCIQTSNEILSQFTKTKGDVAETVQIKPEYSIFEYDLHNHNYHASLPESMEERKWYFPRVDLSYKTMFVPKLPEDCDMFMKRCDEAIQHVEKAYPIDSSKRVIILVSHAAGCVAMAKSASRKTLQDINAAAPCAIYRLTREVDDDTASSGCEKGCWDIDHYSKEDGMNGYSKHLTDMGAHTIPWNHFGPKGENNGPTKNGWTGPPTDAS